MIQRNNLSDDDDDDGCVCCYKSKSKVNISIIGFFLFSYSLCLDEKQKRVMDDGSWFIIMERYLDVSRSNQVDQICWGWRKPALWICARAILETSVRLLCVIKRLFDSQLAWSE